MKQRNIQEIKYVMDWDKHVKFPYDIMNFLQFQGEKQEVKLTLLFFEVGEYQVIQFWPMKYTQKALGHW